MKIDKEKADRILYEEQAVRYMSWLFVPSSAEFLRNAISGLKKDKSLYRQEIKKMCKDAMRLITYIDHNTATCSHDDEEIWAYDDMMTNFVGEMSDEVGKIKDALSKEYKGTLKEHIVNFALACNISRIHGLCLDNHQKALMAAGSRLNIGGAINLNKRVNSIAQSICELLEKKSGTILPEKSEEFNEICMDYFKKLYEDEEMHARIQQPIVEYNKKLNKEAEDKCGEILNQPIDILVLSPKTKSILIEGGVDKIGDLYEENKGYRKIKGIGEKRMEEIKGALKRLVVDMLLDTRVIQPS